MKNKKERENIKTPIEQQSYFVFSYDPDAKPRTKSTQIKNGVKQKKSTQKKDRVKKKNTMVFIDAENISPKKCPVIFKRIKEIGEVLEMRYYARQKDNHTSRWKECAHQYDLKPILMKGGPSENKIDNKIMKDIQKMMLNNKSIDVYVIVSRDGDFTKIINEIKDNQKRAVIVGPEDTSNRLKEIASEYIEI